MSEVSHRALPASRWIMKLWPWADEAADIGLARRGKIFLHTKDGNGTVMYMGYDETTVSIYKINK